MLRLRAAFAHRFGETGPRSSRFLVGNRGRVEIDARQTMAKESSILGMSLWHLNDEQLSGLQDAMAAGFASGSLTPVVGSELPLAEAAAAHIKVYGGGTTGKIVIKTL